MKKLLLALGLMALLAGCASHDNSMGGTSDQEFNNNATHGTGTSTATNGTPRNSARY